MFSPLSIRDIAENFVKERNYHLTEDEVLAAVKFTIDELLHNLNISAAFDMETFTLKKYGDNGVQELPASWICNMVNPKALIRMMRDSIEKYEREKVFSLFSRSIGSIVHAEPVGETFFLGQYASKTIDVPHGFDGTIREFGSQYGIYVEHGGDEIDIPPGRVTMWNLARYLYTLYGYTLSINPHRELLRIKKQPKAVLWNLNGVDAIMPSDERIPGEDYLGSPSWEVILYNVNQTSLEGFQLYVSRRQIEFLYKYILQYIPDLRGFRYKAIARIPGVLSKILIEKSNGEMFNFSKWKDTLEDISRQLGGERIDIVFCSDRESHEDLLKAALRYRGSIKVNSIAKTAVVVTEGNGKGKVIGKNGANVKLAAMLTGYQISVMTLDEYISDSNIFVSRSSK